MTDHIGKPIDAGRLLEVIERVASLEDDVDGVSSAA